MSTPNPATTDWIPLWGIGLPRESYSVRAYRSTAQSIPNSAWTTISFDAERYDSGGQWVIGSPTRLTCQIAGTYAIFVNIAFSGSAGGTHRLVALQRSGAERIACSGYVASMTGSAAGFPRPNAMTLRNLAVGDYIEAQCYQDSGAALDIVATSATDHNYSEIGMTLLDGPQGPAGAGIPTPVVNGQWIKGSAGAAVWSPIAAGEIVGLVAPDTAWHVLAAVGEPAFGSGWSNYGAPYGPGRFRKLASGLVICEGLLTCPAGTTNAFTFPVGYRPVDPGGGRQLIFTAAASFAGMEQWRLTEAGVMQGQGATAGGWISLAGVQFYAG